MGHREKAIKTLTHYFRYLLPSGHIWTEENNTQIAGAVDNIIEASVEHFAKFIEEKERKARMTPQPCPMCQQTVVYEGKPNAELAAMHHPDCGLGAQIAAVPPPQ